jgi:hypothetical protein
VSGAVGWVHDLEIRLVVSLLLHVRKHVEHDLAAIDCELDVDVAAFELVSPLPRDADFFTSLAFRTKWRVTNPAERDHLEQE